MQNILVLGANGLVGHKAVFALHSLNFNVIASARRDNNYFSNIECLFEKLDITNIKDVKSVIRKHSIDIVVNCSAYTNVDGAETNKEECNSINAIAVEQLAKYCDLKDIFLVHISTDYVFDGLNGPYTESSKPNPLGVYGSSKLGGDNAILALNSNYCILRAIVVYGKHIDELKKNFVSWLISELRENRNVRIVDDQIGTFTFAEDLVDAIVSVINHKSKGIYNISGNELMSRYDMSVKIAEILSLNKQLISPVKTSEFNQAAKRPLNSGFIIDKAKNKLKFKPTSLADSIKKIDKQMQR